MLLIWSRKDKAPILFMGSFDQNMVCTQLKWSEVNGTETLKNFP
jgi:hypothetical protein